jgi:hypothetical protein
MELESSSPYPQEPATCPTEMSTGGISWRVKTESA